MNQELSKLSRANLLNKCRELKITKYSSKNKSQLVELIQRHNTIAPVQPKVSGPIKLRIKKTKPLTNTLILDETTIVGNSQPLTNTITLDETTIVGNSQSQTTNTLILDETTIVGNSQSQTTNTLILDETTIMGNSQSQTTNTLILDETTIMGNSQPLTNTLILDETTIVSNSQSQTTNTLILDETTIHSDNQLKFIDLFCGIGGFHQAMERLRGKCVLASDIDEQCRKTYENNYNLKPHGDVTKIDPKTIPDFDIICGGFPCQAFSNSGHKKGFEDKRGQLFENILNIAAHKRPRFMFLENVKHIKKIDDGKIFEHILKRIHETGYNVTTYELSPHEFGVPQQRERVVFVCIRLDIYNPEIVLDMTPPNTAIHFENILEKDTNTTSKYRISPEDEEILTVWDKMIGEFEVGETLSPTILCNEFTKVYSTAEFKKLPAWKQDYITKNKPIYNKYKAKWDAWLVQNNAILTKKEIFGKLEWQTGKKKEGDSIFNHFIQFRQSGIRVKRAEYFPTLVAIVQTPIYAKEHRYITPRECARLQSFPDSFKLHETDKIAYKQFGNAVNVDVVHFVISNTLKAYGLCH